MCRARDTARLRSYATLRLRPLRFREAQDQLVVVVVHRDLDHVHEEEVRVERTFANKVTEPAKILPS